MIHYRTFRNGDPPDLVLLWNTCFPNRGAAYLPGSTFLEYFLLAKPYFDPAGLILATADNRPVGFACMGFGPADAFGAVDTSVGILCALGVAPSHRKQGIGSELLRRAEEYLRARGAQTLHAGPWPGLNPFTFAIYGGAQSCGFLASDALAPAFLERHGYRPTGARRILQRSLEQPINVPDGRFPGYRPRYEIHAGPRHGLGWYEEAVIGPVELHEYQLVDKGAGKTVARAWLWEMETYRQRWNEHAVGLTAVEVVAEQRKQGLAKFLLAQLMRHLQDQFFTLMEAHLAADDAAGDGLLRGLGFQQVDTGRTYTRNP